MKLACQPTHVLDFIQTTSALEEYAREVTHVFASGTPYLPTHLEFHRRALCTAFPDPSKLFGSA